MLVVVVVAWHRRSMLLAAGRPCWLRQPVAASHVWPGSRMLSAVAAFAVDVAVQRRAGWFVVPTESDDACLGSWLYRRVLDLWCGGRVTAAQCRCGFWLLGRQEAYGLWHGAEEC
jgi:hypothetical protein